MTTPLYPGADPSTPRLRVGVVLAKWTVPAWTADVLRSVEQSEVGQLAVFIIDPGPPPATLHSKSSLQDALLRRTALPRFLWDRYVERDLAWHKAFARPFSPTNVRAMATGVTIIHVDPVSGGVDD